MAASRRTEISATAILRTSSGARDFATGVPQSADADLLTLDHIAEGGIYDHLGGGFARYSTDERWLVPHFEKMLYDNALLVELMTEVWRERKASCSRAASPRRSSGSCAK